MKTSRRLSSRFTLPAFVSAVAMLLPLATPLVAGEPPVFLRFRVQQPSEGTLEARVGGVRKQGPNWDLPTIRVTVQAGAWSEWIDLTNWPLHKRMTRAGGLAEWPSGRISLQRAGARGRVESCVVDIQLAEKPEEPALASGTEKAGYDSVWFLIPRPLREHAGQFETGSQMTARHQQWAREIVGDTPITLRKFDICTSLWGEPDPTLARQDVETLKMLGFNVINGAPTDALRDAGMHILGKTWSYVDDPGDTIARGRRFLQKRSESPDEAWEAAHTRHVVINDEVKTLTLKKVPAEKRDAWFREYLKARGITAEALGTSPEQANYPYEALTKETLPWDSDLNNRRLLYHASKFRQAWSARQLRLTSDQIRIAMPGMRTETLPTSHGFLAAWGAPHTGMSYSLLDLFEVGRQRSVDVLSAEDWLGLNHMYGPSYTWTGAQSFEYLSAVMRSAMAGTDMTLLSLITPSDDRYLRLKAFSSLGQGAKAFFFWTYGPTFMGDENYWSDLRSEYEGIAKLTRVLQKSEEVLASAQVVSDRVAVLYSVSHDFWHTNRRAAFVEKRLLWHGLRHVGVQPDFVCEEDAAGGKLRNYKVLFVADHCVSAAAMKAIDAWVREGGTLYLSAGACTRDETYEPAPPALLTPVLKSDWLAAFQQQTDCKFNERTDLRDATPFGQVRVDLGDASFDTPALGCRINLQGDQGVFARFDDGSPAGVRFDHGRGRVWALGFMPMLAYGQGAKFASKSLKEKWPAGPRGLLNEVLAAAKVDPVARPNVPVVEASLLSGPRASALVLANYTYEPIERLGVRVRTDRPVTRAVSCETGREVPLSHSGDGMTVTLPLEWTDIVLLEHASSATSISN